MDSSSCLFFRREYYEAIGPLPSEERDEIYEAIFDYAFDEAFNSDACDFSNQHLKSLFVLITSQIDRDAASLECGEIPD